MPVTHNQRKHLDTLIDPEVDEVPAPDPTRITGRRGLLILGTLLILVGLNLRTLFSSFAAVLTEVRADTGMQDLAVTALTSLPVLLLGLFAPVAPILARRFGAEKVILAAMLLLTVGLATRGLGQLTAMLAGSAAAGIAIGLINVLLPGLVKRDFRHRLGLMSGLYTTAICAAAALGAGFTHPILDLTGSWQASLAFWAVPACAAMLLWAPIALRQQHSARAVRPSGPNVWKSRTAWQITAYMSLQAMMSFSVFAWLAPILRDRGIDGGTAGLIVAVSIILQMAGSLAAPALAAKLKHQSILNLVVAVMAGGGFALTILGPVEMIWIWAGLLGLGQGSLTAAALTMIVLRTRDSHTAAHLSGMMQGVGYSVGSTGTLLVSQLHTWTGTFQAAATMFALIGTLAAIFGYNAGRARYISD